MFSFFSLGHSAKEGSGYNIAISNPDLTKVNKMLNNDNYNEAIKLLKKEIKKHKLNPDLFNLLGYAYRKNKRYKLAIKNYKKALIIDPNHKRTHNYLGITYLKVGSIENPERTSAHSEKNFATKNVMNIKPKKRN